MTFALCVAEQVESGAADQARAERAQAEWNTRRERYAKQGLAPDVADAMAAQDVIASFKKEAGDTRHRFLAQMTAMRKNEAEIANAADLGSVNTDKVEFWAASPNAAASLVGQTNGLRRLFHKRLEALVLRHSRDLLGNNKDKAGLINVARELHGQGTGDKAAQAIAKAVQEAFRDMRRMFNEAGGTIGDLADWGLPHTHDPIAVTKAGYEAWANDVKGRIAWHRIEDYLTGRPMAAEGSMPSPETTDEFLRSVYDSIAFGRDSDKPSYGRSKGANLIKQHGESRVLHFKTADDWIDYNKRFGSGDVYGSIISHAHRMSEDIVALRELGPSPEMMIDYRADLAIAEARKRGDESLADKIRGNTEQAKRMLRIQRGGQQPLTRRQAETARFFSSVRSVMTSAMLEKAIVSSLSDSNSMRMAAQSVGMNQSSPIARHMRLLFDGAEREDMLRAGWIADTLTDPGLLMARWQAEVPPTAIAERLASGVMRAQGLAHWTDQGRIAFQAETAGLFAKNVGRKVADVEEPLRSLLRGKNVTDEEWAAFTRPEHLFTAKNGGTFASPLWWREVTDMDADKADDLFLRMQALVEEQTEFAVPTQNLWARSYVEGNLIPGTLWYEVAKSGLMFKSFGMTFTVNQIGRIMSLKTNASRVQYAADLVAGATVMGAVSLQALNLLGGRDVQEMSPMDNPAFWAQSVLKGGGFGIMGDLLTAGESSYGGGFASFFGGPGIGLVGDVWSLSVGNAIELAQGGIAEARGLEAKPTNIGREVVRFLDRYSPATDLPVVGLAIDRYVWNSLQKLLDPEAEANMAQAVGRRKRDYGTGSWWMPGSLAPERAPTMGMP